MDLTWPFHHHWNAKTAFPGGVFLTTERRRAAIRPCKRLCPIVGGIHDDRVVCDAELVQLGQHLANHTVVLNHAVGINTLAGNALGFRFQPRPDVHAGGVVPDEKRLIRRMRPVHEIKRKLGDFFIDGFHTLHVQRAGILDLAVCDGMNDTPGAEFLGEFRILWVILIFRFVFGVQVIQIPEELVESVIGGQMLIEIAKMILAELSCCVSHRL